MSLTEQETSETKAELQANFKLSGLTYEQAAVDLATTPEHIEAVLNLQVSRIEDPWILLRYLDRQLKAKGQTPVPYSRLNGSPMRHWFLNQGRIRRGLLS